ncbi:hypothetical protein C8F01DRAFT_1173995 [Mycena amicta]|nr:hypothetical protein C8F01DRAFT_1173995 [Mycena amicta]
MFSLNTLCISLLIASGGLLRLQALAVPTAPVNLYNLGADGSTLFFSIDGDQSSLWIRRHQPVENNPIKWSINPAPGGYTITNLDANNSFITSRGVPADASTGIEYLALSNHSTPGVFTFEEVSASEGTFLIKPRNDARVLQAVGIAHSVFDYVKVADIMTDSEFHQRFQRWKFV